MGFRYPDKISLQSRDMRKGAYSTSDGLPRTHVSAVAMLDVLGFSSEIR
jgi:hypothetical protein